MEELNELLSQSSNKRLKFGLHETSSSLFAQVVDRQTGDVVKQFPPQFLLDMRDRIAEQVGGLIDELG
jgi:flagellar protein FlaG